MVQSLPKKNTMPRLPHEVPAEECARTLNGRTAIARYARRGDKLCIDVFVHLHHDSPFAFWKHLPSADFAQFVNTLFADFDKAYYLRLELRMQGGREQFLHKTREVVVINRCATSAEQWALAQHHWNIHHAFALELYPHWR